MSGVYEARGKVLLFPVNGNGKFKITLEKVVSTLKFDIETFSKNNQKYLRGKSSSLKLQTSKASYDFENLFNGNKEISDNLNNVLNDNWKELFDELVPAYTEAYARVLLQIANRIFSKIPLSDIFLDQ
ncbi:hypothetical protein HHI36_022059 [Cryptolaemus montrouzieri]|uniref:Uncharacterized protein n=1 Tax=Cryptolaemus montrouzieri TaxID=559131 RepID=A0ABD2MYZ4_9CUCU